MEENENKNAYSEVIEILKLIDDEEKLEALPIEMLEVLKMKANPEYKPKISKDLPLDEQNLQPETFSILSWIAMKYWQNDIEIQEKLEPEEEQKEQNIEPKEDQNTDSILPIVYNDLKWYQKIKIKIIEIFKKIFGKSREKQEINSKEEGNTI